MIILRVEIFMSEILMSNRKLGLMSTKFNKVINVESQDGHLGRQKWTWVFMSNFLIHRCHGHQMIMFFYLTVSQPVCRELHPSLSTIFLALLLLLFGGKWWDLCWNLPNKAVFKYFSTISKKKFADKYFLKFGVL